MSKLYRVIVKDDPKVINAANFTIIKEDHTLGNLLRTELLKSDNIYFAGYRMPHPLENLMELKVQTDGSITPSLAVKRAISNRKLELDAIKNQFKFSLEKFRNQNENQDNYDF